MKSGTTFSRTIVGEERVTKMTVFSFLLDCVFFVTQGVQAPPDF